MGLILRLRYFVVFFSFFANSLNAAPLYELPAVLPEIAPDSEKIELILGDGSKKNLTIDPWIQTELQRFIRNRGNPIAAVVLADAKTGKILAMAQGRSPDRWAGETHTALHSHFPAASLFKTVVAGAAFELTNMNPADELGLNGGCATVRPTGVWLQDKVGHARRQISFRRAFGKSCNGYFAKIAVNYLGLKSLVGFAKKFGWDGTTMADFYLPRSPMTPPKVRSSSVHAVGRYAAGFGYVGISAVHATWISLAIANDGLSRRLQIFENPESGDRLQLAAKTIPHRVVSPTAAAKIRSMMDATIQGGTASYAFRRRPYRKMRYDVGGKTGTLTGHAPFGVTTWFTGMMPLEDPQVVVSAVVVLEKLWHIKGPNLAAEALRLYLRREKKRALRLSHAHQQ